MSVPSDRNNSTKVIEKLSKYKELEIETTRMWGMRTETVPVIVGALGLIREGMDQNLGKIPGASNINELQKIILLGTAHTKKVSVHQIKTPLVPQDQGLAPVPGECLKQLIALKTFIIIRIIVRIIIIPTRLYACQKTHTDMTGEVTCRLCNKTPESVAHVLAGCTALAQNKYIT